MLTNIMRKGGYVLRIGLVVVCGGVMVLSGCSDDQGKSDAPAPAAVSQPGSAQTPTASSPQTPTAPGGAGGSCTALMTAKCIECHSMARVCEKLGKKSKARWQRTIDRMVERGAKLTPKESADMLVCLENGATNDLQESCR